MTLLRFLNAAKKQVFMRSFPVDRDLGSPADRNLGINYMHFESFQENR